MFGFSITINGVKVNDEIQVTSKTRTTGKWEIDLVDKYGNVVPGNFVASMFCLNFGTKCQFF